MICFICNRTDAVVSFKKTKAPFLCAGCNNQFDKWYEKLYKSIFQIELSQFQSKIAQLPTSIVNQELWAFFHSKDGCFKRTTFRDFNDLCEIKGTQQCSKCRFRIMFHVYKPANTKSTKRVKDNMMKFHNFIKIWKNLKMNILQRSLNVPGYIVEKLKSETDYCDYGGLSPELLSRISNKPRIIKKEEVKQEIGQHQSSSKDSRFVSPKHLNFEQINNQSRSPERSSHHQHSPQSINSGNRSGSDSDSISGNKNFFDQFDHRYHFNPSSAQAAQNRIAAQNHEAAQKNLVTNLHYRNEYKSFTNSPKQYQQVRNQIQNACRNIPRILPHSLASLIQPLSELMSNVDSTPSLNVYLRNPLGRGVK